MQDVVTVSGEWQRDSLSLYGCPFSPSFPPQAPTNARQRFPGLHSRSLLVIHC